MINEESTAPMASHEPESAVKPAGRGRRDPTVGAVKGIIFRHLPFRWPAYRPHQLLWEARGVTMAALRRAVAELEAEGVIRVAEESGEVWVSRAKGAAP